MPSSSQRFAKAALSLRKPAYAPYSFECVRTGNEAAHTGIILADLLVLSATTAKAGIPRHCHHTKTLQLQPMQSGPLQLELAGSERVLTIARMNSIHTLRLGNLENGLDVQVTGHRRFCSLADLI